MGFNPNYSRINADWSRGDSRPLLRFQDPRLLFWNYDRFGFGQGFGEGQNAFHLTLTEQGLAQIWFHDPSQTRRGHTPARGVYNLERNWNALQSHLFGWMPMLTLAFIWLLVLVRRPRCTGRLLLTSAAILMGAHLFYWACGISYGPRYFYACPPCRSSAPVAYNFWSAIPAAPQSASFSWPCSAAPSSSPPPATLSNTVATTSSTAASSPTSPTAMPTA